MNALLFLITLAPVLFPPGPRLTVDGGISGFTWAFLSPGERYLVTRKNQAMQFRRPDTGDVLFSLQGVDIELLAFSPGAARLLVEDGNTLRLLSLPDRKEVYTLPGQQYRHCAAFSPDGTLLALATHDVITLHDAGTGKPIRTFEGHVQYVQDDPKKGKWSMSVTAIRFSRDSKRVYSSGSYPDRSFRLGRVITWEAATGKQLSVVQHAASLLTVSPDERRLAGWHWLGVTAWDMDTGKAVLQLPVNEGDVAGIRFLPDGRCLVLSAFDGELRFWDGASGKRLGAAATEGGHSHALSADLKRLVRVNRRGDAEMWDLDQFLQAKAGGGREVLDFLKEWPHK